MWFLIRPWFLVLEERWNISVWSHLATAQIALRELTKSRPRMSSLYICEMAATEIMFQNKHRRGCLLQNTNNIFDHPVLSCSQYQMCLSQMCFRASIKQARISLEVMLQNPHHMFIMLDVYFVFWITIYEPDPPWSYLVLIIRCEKCVAFVRRSISGNRAWCLQLEAIFERVNKKRSRMSLLSSEKITGNSNCVACDLSEWKLL